jgi:hypothetical protein
MSVFDTLMSTEDQTTAFSNVEVVGGSVLNVESSAKVAAMANVNPAQGDNDLLADYRRLNDEYTAIIGNYGDREIRDKAVAAEQQERMVGLSNLMASSESTDPDGSLRQGAALAAAAIHARDAEDRYRVALEERAIRNIQNVAATDPMQARLLIDNLERGGAEDVLTREMTKDLIIANAVEQAGFKAEESGWFHSAIDFVLSWVPFKYSMAGQDVIDIDKGLKNWYDFMWSGERRQAESSALRNLPAEQLAKIMPEVIDKVYKRINLLGYTNHTEALGVIAGFQRAPGVISKNVTDSFNNLGLLPVTKIGKAAFGIPTMLLRAGGRKQAVSLIAQAAKEMAEEGTTAAAKRLDMTPDAVMDAMKPTIAAIESPVGSVSLGTESSSVLSAASKLAEELPASLNSNRFASAAEQKAAVDAAIRDVLENTGHELKDVKVSELQTTTLSGGSRVHNLELFVGRKAGGGFKTAKEAAKASAKWGYGLSETVVDESGQWFVKIKKDVAETGFYTSELKPPRSGWVLRHLLGARQIVDPYLADLAQQAGNKRGALINAINKDYAQKLGALPRHEKEALRNVLAVGVQRQKWFTRSEFDTLIERGYKRTATDREWEAYNTARNANDIEYAVRNDEVYKTKILKGYETISVDTNAAKVEARTASVINDWNVPAASDRVYDVESGIHYHRNNPLTPKAAENLKAQGYVRINLEQPMVLKDGTTVRNLLAKRKNIGIEPLRREQLPYAQGGHRFYEGKYFSRQTVRGKQPDTGEEFLKNPNTYIVGTKAEVDAWNAVMERARQQYLKSPDAAALDDIFERQPGFPTGDEFIAAMDEGRFQKDQPFVTKYDRELPDEYSATNLQFMGEETETPLVSWLRTTGQMYYSKKGEQLKDWMGELAPVLDPYEAINTSLKNIANITSFSDYKISAVERWAKNFAKYTDVDPNASALSIFANGKLKKDIPYALKNAAEAQREVIRRNIGWKSETDMAYDQFSRNTAEFIIGRNPTSLQHKIGVNALEWWKVKDPIQSLRGFAFDAKLGLFNVAQLPLQMATMAATFTLSPKHAMSSMVNVPFLRWSLRNVSTDADLRMLAEKGLAKQSGLATEEYIDMMRMAKQSGFFDFQRTHQLVNHVGPSATMSEMGNTLDKVRMGGRFFFNEAEMWNRATAWQVAWKETRERFPTLKLDSAEFSRRLMGRAEEYSFSMSEQSSAWWQHGVMSIPTQFWAYNMRMLEAMSNIIFPGTFTRAQAARLIVGQSLLYGSAGLAPTAFISEQLKKHNGDAPDIDTWVGALDRGLLDEMIYHATGADVLAGKRVATGTWMPELVASLMGESAFGEKSFTDIAGGVTLSVTKDTGAALLDVIKYAAAESGAEDMPITRDSALKLVSNITTINQGMKAYMIAKYGTLVTAKGSVIAADLPPSYAFAAALGYQPGKSDELTAMVGYMKNKSKAEDDAAKVITNYRAKMLTEPDKVLELSQQINLFVRLLPPDVRQGALRKAHKNTDKSLYDGYAKRVEQKKNQVEMLKGSE